MTPWLPFEASVTHSLHPTGPGRAVLLIADGAAWDPPEGWTVGPPAPCGVVTVGATEVPGTRAAGSVRYAATERNWTRHAVSYTAGGNDHVE